jgi:hypothetical protein
VEGDHKVGVESTIRSSPDRHSGVSLLPGSDGPSLARSRGCPAASRPGQAHSRALAR